MRHEALEVHKELTDKVNRYRYILAELLGVEESEVDQLIAELGPDGIIEKHAKAQDDRIAFAVMTFPT